MKKIQQLLDLTFWKFVLVGDKYSRWYNRNVRGL